MLQLEHGVVMKYLNQDFFVSEVSYIPADTSNDPNGTHTFLRLRKEGYTTFEAMRLIADFFETQREDIHCQGLKDEDGITEQLISVKAIVHPEDANRFNNKHAQLKKGWANITVNCYSPLPVTEKGLHGNVFRIRLRNIKEADANNLLQFCADSSDFVCGNYYDYQRFGLPGGPYIAHKIGEAIVQDDWQTANKLYLESGNAQLDFPNVGDLSTLRIEDVDVRKLGFFVGAYNSFLWNQLLSEHISGDTSLSIFYDHKVAALDQDQKLPVVISAESFKLDANRRAIRYKKARTSIISTTVFADSKQPDEHFPGKYSVDLQFFLPAGSYATMLSRQLVLSALKCLVLEPTE